jgi:hypothetical protein
MNQQNSAYFSKELMDKMDSMSHPLMMELIKGLHGTDVWTAILKYNMQRLSYNQGMINSIDPTKDAGLLARAQGVMMGISDLQSLVIELNKAPPQE